jgi:hypothetical protein
MAAACSRGRAALVAAALATAVPAAAQAPAPAEGVAPRIDASTAAEARRAIEAAGYSGVSGLRKGLDNFWHAQARRGGATVRVVVTPDRKVIEEGE